MADWIWNQELDQISWSPLPCIFEIPWEIYRLPRKNHSSSKFLFFSESSPADEEPMSHSFPQIYLTLPLASMIWAKAWFFCAYKPSSSHYVITTIQSFRKSTAAAFCEAQSQDPHHDSEDVLENCLYIKKLKNPEGQSNKDFVLDLSAIAFDSFFGL